MSPADKRNLEAWIGKRVRIEWVKPEDDWPYFKLLKIDSAADVVFLQGADYPDGSAKHDGDSFWADWPDIKHIAPVKGCPKCGFDDMRAKAAEHRDGRLSALEDVAVLRGERGVLVRLLVESDKVLSTLEGESTYEQAMLEGLRRQILAATAQHRPQETELLSARAGLGA